MGRKSRIVAAGIALFLTISSAIAQEDSAVGGDVVSPLSLNNNPWTPDLADRRFDAVQIGFSTNFGVGCDGIPRFAPLTRVGSEVERSFQYLRQNALGLAVNYLVYSNPTLYSFLENLNRAEDFLAQHFQVSCNSVREYGLTSQERKYASKAKERCLREEGDSKACDSGEVLEQYKNEIVQEHRDRMEMVTGKSLPNTMDVVLSFIPEQARNKRDSIYELDLDEVWLSMIPGREYREDGSVTNRASEKTLSDLISEAAEKYRESVTDMVDSEDYKRSQGYADLSDDTASRTMSPLVLDRLREWRDRSPEQYALAVELLGREMAISKGKEEIAELEKAIVNARLNADEELLNETDIEQLKRSLELLKADINIMEQRIDSDKRQSDLMRQILEIE